MEGTADIVLALASDDKHSWFKSGLVLKKQYTTLTCFRYTAASLFEAVGLNNVNLL